MSLFSGIKFSSEKAKSLAAESAAAASASAPSALASSASTPAPGAGALASTSTFPQASSVPTPPVVNPLLGGTDKKHTPKPASTSASLQFAPRRPNKPPRPAPKVVYSAAPTSSAVVEAAPVLIVPPPAAAAAAPEPKTDEIVLDAEGNPVVRAPAMTLAAALKQKGKDGQQQRKRKKKRKRQQQQVYHAFQPDEEYDPNRPNDLGEYQHYREQLRQERQARFMEQKRRRAAGEASDDSSYYTDSSDDAPARRDAPKLFAPPKMYDAPTGRRQSPPPPKAAPPQLPQPQPQSGDDAYAHRAAVSASTGEDAYARRMAMSAATGDDAYARRLAMSQQQQQQPSRPPPSVARPPVFTPPVRPQEPSSSPASASAPLLFRPPPAVAIAGAPAPFRPPPAHLLAGAPLPGAAPFRPPPSHLMAGAPRLPPPGGALPPFPPTMPGLPPRPPVSILGGAPAPAPVPEDYQKQLEEKMRAAEAVAAKFRALSGQPELKPAPPADDDRSGSFAERMFRKWGHTEGKGLGVREDGITHALTAEHVQPQVDASKMSKRALAKARAAAANAKTRKWVQAPNARGRIVNANEDVRSREDLDKYGEVSRVVCLTGVAEDPEEIPDSLTDEIGEECSKHGIVERVVLHLVEPPPADAADGLRVFVVFSGIAGSWRATRELDGLSFAAGQKIRARYFDEGMFNSGERDASF